MKTPHRHLPCVIAILFFLTAAADAGTTAFVTSSTENVLSVIDTSDGTLLVTIPAGRSPRGVAFSPDGKWMYIAQRLDDTILVISASDFSVKKTLSACDSPGDIAISPDGRLLYAACRDGIEVIGTADDAVSDLIVSVREPSGLALSPDGLRLFVTSAAEGTLTVIDVRDRNVYAVIDFGNAFRPSGVRVAPGDDFLYVTGFSSTKTLVLDTQDLAVKASVDLGLEPSGIAFTPDGARAYIQHAREGLLSEIQTADHRVIGRKPFGSPARCAASVPASTVAGEAASGSIAIPVAGAITTPTFLSAHAAGLTQINLNWTDNSDNETGFIIERRASDSSFSEVYRVGVNISYYRDTGLAPYTTYYYRVRAYNSSTGEYSAYTNEASATTNLPGGDDDNDFLFCSVGYILTGTPFDGLMSRLRDFRDRVLLKNTVGKQLVKFYYDQSPALVKWLRKKPGALKQISAVVLIPLICIMLYPAVVTAIPIFVLLPFFVRRFRREADAAVRSRNFFTGVSGNRSTTKSSSLREWT